VGYTWNVRQYSTTVPSDAPPDETLTPPDSAATSRGKGLDVRTITESALLMDVTVLLVLLRVLFPVPGLQGLVRLACPIPFVLLALRRGTRAGLVATVASFVLLSCFIGPIIAAQNIFVFGGLGTLFAWASRHRWRPSVTVIVGATLYGLLYLLPPFLFGLYVLRINLAHVLNDVHKQANTFLNSLSHLRFLSIRLGEPFVAFFSSFALGRTVLDGLHGIALTMLTHPLTTLVVFFTGYSLINVWAYLVVGIELFRRLPDEARRDPQGRTVDFFPLG